MYRIFNYCSYDNAIGSVGMSGKSLATYACVQFQGYSGYKTMPEAVALMQPRRVILTFGTNDLSSSYSASSFASDYAKGIKAVQDAYPSVDIIVNAIPPLGQQHSNQNLTQTQVDEYNKALVQMCQDNGWKFLNSAEVLKDSSTGYAKSGYVLSSDGIHLTEQAMDALFTYIRTHSYITEDTRPALTAVPTHTGDKDVSVGSNIVSSTTAAIAPETTEAPDEDASDSSSSNGPDWADGTSGSYATATPDPEYTYWSEIIAPTCTEQGYTYYHCNEDSSKDYKSEYVNALGHDFQNGYCTRCGARFDAAYIQNSTGVPHCPCGGVIKPDVVLYEESLNGRTLQKAVGALERADLLIVGGTSLNVYPAAGLLEYYHGGPVVLINRDETPFDRRADLIFRQPIGQVLDDGQG